MIYLKEMHKAMLSKRNTEIGKCLSIFQTEKITDRITSGIMFLWSYEDKIYSQVTQHIEMSVLHFLWLIFRFIQSLEGSLLDQWRISFHTHTVLYNYIISFPKKLENKDHIAIDISNSHPGALDKEIHGRWHGTNS